MEKQLTIPTCKNFTGYKPCYPDHNCWENGCKENVAIGIKILIINIKRSKLFYEKMSGLPGACA